MDVLKITASDSGVLRLPEYLAGELGYFRELDLEVKSHTPEPWNKVLADIDSGDRDVACDGLWLPSLYRNRVRDYYAFAKVACRYPMSLVSRRPTADFAWKDLEGKIVLIPGSNNAGVRVYFLGCADVGGADIGKIKYVPNFYEPMLSECFAGGWGDYVVLHSDGANRMAAAGVGHVALDLAAATGPVPWLAYYTTAKFLDDRSELAGRFTLGLARACAWLRDNGGDACRDVLAKHVPDIPSDAAASLVDQYRAAGMWEGTTIGRDELARWEGFMAKERLIESAYAYGAVVDVRPGEWAARKLG